MITKAPIANQYTTGKATDEQVLLVRQMRELGYRRQEILDMTKCTMSQYNSITKLGCYRNVHVSEYEGVGFN